jgi:U4/U6.U5 tri-snRNP-associated protein 1
MSAPKAVITREENGESSCSVEETNRIRALLGMKPLDMSNGAQPTVVIATSAAEHEASDAVRARVEKAKRERETAQLRKAQSLGQVLKTNEQLSAADWVSQSRKQASAPGAGAGAGANRGAQGRSAAGAYTARDLAGLRIRHDADSFVEGGEGTVLTFADRGVLDSVAQGQLGLADEEGDELVNVELGEQERVQQAIERKRAAKRPMYSGVDDEEFVESGRVPPRETSNGRPVLAQYDRDIDGNLVGEKGRRGRLVIAGEGFVQSTDLSGADAVRARLTAAAAAREAAVVDLDRGRPGQQGTVEIAVLGAEDFASLQKPLAKKLNLRKAGRDEEGSSAGAAAAVTDGLVSDLMQQRAAAGTADAAADRGSRARRGLVAGNVAAEEAAVAAANAASYAIAQAKATAKFGGTIAPQTTAMARPFAAAKPLVLPSAVPSHGGEAGKGASGHRVYSRLRAGGEEEGDGEDDYELQAMLARSRRVAQQHATVVALAAGNGASATRGAGAEDAVGLRVLDLAAAHRGVNGDGAGAAGSGEGEGMTFNNLTEFSRLLQVRIAEKTGDDEAELASKVGSAAASRAAAVALPATEAADADDMDMDVSDDGEGGDGEEGEEEEEEDEGEEGTAAFSLGFSGADPSRAGGGGVAAAMRMFAATGAILNKESYTGRANDARPDWDTAHGGSGAGAEGPTVVLEYKDESGRKLTAKEAYRQLSYKFHGRAPSKTVRDKRLKRMLRESAMAKGSAAAGGPAGTGGSLAGMRRVQEVTGSAHVTLGKK